MIAYFFIFAFGLGVVGLIGMLISFLVEARTQSDKARNVNFAFCLGALIALIALCIASTAIMIEYFDRRDINIPSPSAEAQEWSETYE